MQTVEVTDRLDAPPSAVEDALSPRAIIEYESTYEVQSVEKHVDDWLVFVNAPKIDTVFRFTELSAGYEYKQDDEGPFEQFRTTVTMSEANDTSNDDDVEEEANRGITCITFRSEFTFGGLAAPLLNRLAARSRRDELERAIIYLSEDLDATT